jgi:magnesium transporter
MDVLQEETTEDIQKMAGINPSGKPYLKTSVFHLWYKRIPWLMLLMVSATFTGSIISAFEDAISAMVVLAVFIPMLMDTGGNSGGQAAATIIIGLSLGDISKKDILKVIWKEFRVALICGFTLSVVGFAKAMIIDKTDVLTALVVCITLIFVVIIAKVTGCVLPIFAKRLGFDPAVMSSPIITTVVDVLALLVYFGIATALLPQLK